MADINQIPAPIGEAELALRKAFLDFGAQDVARLKSLDALLAGAREAIINEFYAHLLAFEPTSAFFGDEAKVLRLKQTQSAYFAGLTAGDYGTGYVCERLRIGATHQRIGLATPWYIGGYAKYLNLALARLWQARGLPDGEALEMIQALLKIVFFDMTLAIDTYMHERQQTIERKLAQLAALNQVATALTATLDGERVLQEIMQCAVRFTGSYASCVALYEVARGEFRDWVTLGLSEHFVRNMTFPSGTLPHEVFATGRAVLSNDRPGTRHRLSALARAEGIRAFLCLPLRVHDDPVGILYVYRRDRDEFGADEIDLLGTFAHLAAAAISRARIHARMAELASKDGLTGVFNRRSFDERLATELRRARRYGRELALLALDLDHFKRVNDTYGHQAGDAVLKSLAARIQCNVRTEADFVARLGGEEFAVLLPETGLAAAYAAAERIRAAVEAAPVPINGDAPLRVTVSIGLAALHDCDGTPEGLHAAADRALYAAKLAGRNRVVVWSGDQRAPSVRAEPLRPSVK